MKRAPIVLAAVVALTACSGDATEPEPLSSSDVAAAALEKHGEMFNQYRWTAENTIYDQCSGTDLGVLVTGAECDNAVMSMIELTDDLLQDIDGAELVDVAEAAATVTHYANQWAADDCKDLPLGSGESGSAMSCSASFVALRLGVTVVREVLAEAAGVD